MLHYLALIAFALHIGGGGIALVSGTVAAFARKGDGLHRRAGKVFVLSMFVMATFAVYLAIAMPGQLVNVFIGTFAFYLVATAWMTARRRERVAGLSDKIVLLVSLSLCAPFAILSFQLAAGVAPWFKSAVAFEGPVLIAIYGFTLVLILAAVGDARVVAAGGLSGTPRIARHLWRMCVGLTLATGSAFTNGFARFLPGPYHVPPVFFLPQLLPLLLLIFWMIRIRLAGWRPS